METAPPSENFSSEEESFASEGYPEEVSPPFWRKFWPFLLVAVLLFFGAGYFFLQNFSSPSSVSPSPTIRPTATPFAVPTLPQVSLFPSVSPLPSLSASPSARIGRLAFLKEGDIYQSDFSSFSLLVKNATPAADKLSWSPLGSFLAWRPRRKESSPSSLVIYHREKNQFTFLETKEREILDYAFSPLEKTLALLTQQSSSFRIETFSLASPSAVFSLWRESALAVRKIFWLKEEDLLFWGEEGLRKINLASPSAEKVLVPEKILFALPSPEKNLLLYSLGTAEKSDLYLFDLKEEKSEKINPQPPKIEMGKSGLSPEILAKGFLPYALWFPQGKKLFVGYHYLPGLPLTGVYDLEENSFFAFRPFFFKSSDILTEDLLIGERVNTTGKIPSWQIVFFTLEKEAALNMVRVIPEAFSPAFFPD